MDTRAEIARDEWWQKHLGECGTCRWMYKQNGWRMCEIHGCECEFVEECDSWIERRSNVEKKRWAREMVRLNEKTDGYLQGITQC